MLAETNALAADSIAGMHPLIFVLVILAIIAIVLLIVRGRSL